jgi:hemerythrin-like domain-containing protein
MPDEIRRRSVLLGTAALALGACSGGHHGGGGDGDEDVSPPEDLMREHGVLNRVLLVYDDAAERLDLGTPLPVEALESAASIIQRFVEGYHERDEESFVFPRFEEATRLLPLVTTLRRQHQAGRDVTAFILKRVAASPIGSDRLASESDRCELAAALRSFGRMYRPHEAREDTVLFPALRGLVSEKEMRRLGESFEEEEHRLFGSGGFEKIVNEVATVERAFGTYDLDKFTPS